MSLFVETEAVDTSVRLKRGDTDTCSGIKDANLLVATTGNKRIAEWLPDTTVDRVGMIAESLTRFLALNVPNLDRRIQRSRQETTSIVIRNAPNGLCMFLQSRRSDSLAKVPDLDGTIA